MEMDQASGLGGSFNGLSQVTAAFPAGQQTQELCQTFGLKESPSKSLAFPSAPPPPSVTRMSLAEIDSLISPLIRRRSEGFMQHEIKLMIEEISKRRHILLSKLPGNSRLKKKAWEEVAHDMALRNPNEPQRSGAQIKKKWENIVMKTKKKIREGQLTQELERNEVTKMVTQFLAATSQEMLHMRQMHSLQPDGDGGSSQVFSEMPQNLPDASQTASVTNNGNTQMLELMKPDNPEIGGNHDGVSLEPVQMVKKEENDRIAPNFVDAVNGITTTVGSANDSSDENNEEEEDDDSSDSDIATFANSHTTGSSGGGDTVNPTTITHLRGRKGKTLEKELIRQYRTEHALRLKILQMKHQYWQLKIDSVRGRGRNSTLDS